MFPSIFQTDFRTLNTACDSKQMVDHSWARSADAAWWIKVRRADLHLRALEQATAAYLDRADIRIVSERIGDGQAQYVLRVSEPVPTDIGAIIGDVLHNLRSALDCAAFGLVAKHTKQPLTAGQERAISYPIFTNPERVVSFLHERRSLFGDGERRTITRLQPGYHSADLKDLGLDEEPPSEEELTHDDLYLLDQLCNIDKHRRLHVTVLHPEMIYWASDGRTSSTWTWGTPPYADGSVIGTITDTTSELPPAELHHEFVLALDNPQNATGVAVIALLSSIRRTVACDVLPRLLASSGTTIADRPDSVERTWSPDLPRLLPEGHL